MKRLTMQRIYCLIRRSLQSLFAKPSGQGLSSSTVNAAFLNPAAGYGLICHGGTFDPRATRQVVAVGLGVLVTGLTLARSFGRFNGGTLFNKA